MLLDTFKKAGKLIALSAIFASPMSELSAEVRFLATADPQYSQDLTNTVAQSNPDSVFRQMASMHRSNSNNYRGALVAGDLTNWYARNKEWNLYVAGRQVLIDSGLPLYQGLGNHDLPKILVSTDLGVSVAPCASDNSTPPRSLPSPVPLFSFIENLVRDEIEDFAHDDCSYRPILGGELIPNTSDIVNRQQFGSLYSWNWDDIHFVSAGMVPSNTWTWDVAGSMRVGALDFLKKDLAKHAKNNKPVVLMFHYNWQTVSSEWSDADKLEFWQALDGYNIIAFITGHKHLTPEGETMLGITESHNKVVSAGTVLRHELLTRTTVGTALSTNVVSGPESAHHLNVSSGRGGTFSDIAIDLQKGTIEYQRFGVASQGTPVWRNTLLLTKEMKQRTAAYFRQKAKTNNFIELKKDEKSTLRTGDKVAFKSLRNNRYLTYCATCNLGFKNATINLTDEDIKRDSSSAVFTVTRDQTGKFSLTNNQGEIMSVCVGCASGSTIATFRPKSTENASNQFELVSNDDGTFRLLNPTFDMVLLNSNLSDSIHRGFFNFFNPNNSHHTGHKWVVKVMRETKVKAALKTNSNSIYGIRSDNRYFKFNTKKTERNGTADLSNFPGMNDYKKLVVAGYTDNTSHHFFLSDGRVLEYDLASNRVRSMPQAIFNSPLRQLHDDRFNIAATALHNDRLFVFIEGTSLYKTLNLATGVLSGPFDYTLWGGLKHHGNNISAAIVTDDETFHLFTKDNKYYSYDMVNKVHFIHNLSTEIIPQVFN